jgi:hypothetical protein
MPAAKRPPQAWQSFMTSSKTYDTGGSIIFLGIRSILLRIAIDETY